MKSVKGWLVILLTCLGISCKGPEGPTGPGYDDLTDPSVKPRVIYTYPEENTAGPYENFGSTILVRFNKIMDRTTLRRALHLVSPDNDVYADTTLISTSTGDIYTIYARPTNTDFPFRWKIGQTYTLQIDTTAEDVNGNRLKPEFSLSFIPEPYFRVTSSYPSNGSVDINPQSTINLRFNDAIDTSMFSAIRIAPSVSGFWRYPKKYTSNVDSTYISFVYSSNSRLNTNTVYSITIPDTIHDKSGHLLQYGFSSTFTTMKFEVTNTYPSDGSTDVNPSYQQIRIQFSDAVDTSTVRKGIIFSPNLAGIFSISADERAVYFITSNDLPTSSLITVTVDTSVRSKSGNKLLQPYIFSFTTSAFAITWTYPYDADTNVSVDQRIQIYCNGEIDNSSVQTAFSITPNVPGLFNAPQFANYFTFSPLMPLSPNTWYTVSISTALRSANGEQLTQPCSFTFRTVPFKVLYSNIQNGTTGFPRNTSMYFSFSLYLDTASVRNAFHISPDVQGTISYYSEPTRYFNFSPVGGFEAYTIYTVTIDTSLMSKTGHHLSVPYQITFATGE